MKLIILLILISSLHFSEASINVGQSCVVSSPTATCTTAISSTNNTGKKSCLWRKAENNKPLLKLTCGGINNNLNYNWNESVTTGDSFDLRSHDTWQGSIPLTDYYNSGQLMDSKQVFAEYGNIQLPNQNCSVSNSSSFCTTLLTVEKQGSKKTCLWRKTPLQLKSCHGASLNNWSYNWAQTSLSGDVFELKAHDIWPSQEQNGITYAYNTALLLDSKIIKAELLGEPPLDPSVNKRGGTNYHWFYHKYDRNNPNDFPSKASEAVLDYGIIKNYHRKFDYSTESVGDIMGQNVRDIVLGQLNDMHENGQERLRVGIWHSRTESNTHGTFLNSKNKLVPGKNEYLDSQYLDNIELFMTDIKNAGFLEVMFSFYPNGSNRPELWKNWASSPNYQSAIDATFNGDQLILTAPDPTNEPLWVENWRVIKEVKARLNNSGVDYIVDLGNEAIPTVNINSRCTQDLNSSTAVNCLCPPIDGAKLYESTYQTCLANNTNEINLLQVRWEKLIAKVWDKYVKKYGASDTVGYSIISRNASDFNQRYPTLSKVYSNGVYPNTFSLHIYDGVWVGHDDAFGGLNAAFVWKENNGMNTKFIIGETDYNDSVTAQQFKNVLTGNRELEFILQWPKGRGFLYRIDPPYSFSNYIDEGF